MNTFDATTLGIAINRPSRGVLSASLRRSNQTASTRLPRNAKPLTRILTLLGDASNGNHGEMLPPRPILDAHLDHRTGLSSNERMRSHTGNRLGAFAVPTCGEQAPAGKKVVVRQSPVTHFGFEMRLAWGAEVSVKQQARTRFLVSLACIWLTSSCHRTSHVSDEQLLHLFATHRAEFDALAREAATGSARAIANAEFQRQMKELGVRDVLVAGGSSDPIVRFSMSNQGLVTHGSEKGILRTRRDLQPVVDSLNALPEGRGEKYRRIDDGWYLYLVWD
jgi:hypothetical protein